MFLFLNSALFKAKIFMYFYFCLNSKWLPKDELCDLANPKPHWLQSPRAKIIKWSKAYLYILLDLTSAKRTTLRVVEEMLKDAKLAKPIVIDFDLGERLTYVHRLDSVAWWTCSSRLSTWCPCPLFSSVVSVSFSASPRQHQRNYPSFPPQNTSPLFPLLPIASDFYSLSLYSLA